jgi:Spy/CpxP family protein refolding chaperone
MKSLLTICLLLMISVVQAQDVFQESLYSADLVMKHQEKINLSEQQRERIKKIHSQNAGDFSSLKWDLDAATDKLKAMLNERSPNQSEVQRQMDKVLALENSLKQKQLATLVAIKNELRAEQQDELKKLKGESRNVRGFASVRSASSGSNGVAMTIRNDSSGEQPSFYITTKSGLTKIKDISDISPDEIKGIEVLKGETAVERMGKDGKNGVVIITLKDGASYQF